VLSNYLTSIADQFDVYLAFHSYSQLLLFPYGHNNDQVSNYDELVNSCTMDVNNNYNTVIANCIGQSLS
jgi:hypothetical protein